MPFTKSDLDTAPISFCGENQACVLTGPGSMTVWREEKILLDGRQYEVGGEILFKDRREVRASLRIDTTTFDFLHKGSVYIYLDEIWYNHTEPELFQRLSMTEKDAQTFWWIPDLALGEYGKGPFKFEWW